MTCVSHGREHTLHGALKRNTVLTGQSSSVAQIEADIRTVANRRCSVLIEGETVTGKRWSRVASTPRETATGVPGLR